MWALMNKYRELFQIACWGLLACAVLPSAYSSGYNAAKLFYTAKIADIQRDHGEQRLRMEQQHRAAEQHWQQFSQTQTAELVKAQQEIDRRTDHIQQKNHHAIQQDTYHRDYNGVGDNSLRQYNRAFGYAD